MGEGVVIFLNNWIDRGGYEIKLIQDISFSEGEFIRKSKQRIYY
jgi:hypothetical protein